MLAQSLISVGPHPDIPETNAIFAPFVGSWDLSVTWYEDGEVVRQQNGEWHFAWVLEGRAIQDVWIVPRRDERAKISDQYEYGTSIRFYDPYSEAWRSTWIGPMHGIVRSFKAYKSDGMVILETAQGEIDEMRWVFSDISKDTFVWRNSIRRGERWVLQQDFIATRVPQER